MLFEKDGCKYKAGDFVICRAEEGPPYIGSISGSAISCLDVHTESAWRKLNVNQIVTKLIRHRDACCDDLRRYG